MVLIHSRILLSQDLNNVIAATWVDLETVMLGEISQREKDKYHMISYDITYMWNVKKNSTKSLIYKTEIESQVQKTNIWLPGRREGINWAIETDIYTVLYIKYTNKNLLYGTGISGQYSAMVYMGKESEKEGIYVYV